MGKPSVISPTTCGGDGVVTNDPLITGASFVPAMVMVTFWVTVPPFWLLIVTAYVWVRVSPACKKSVSASVKLNCHVIFPEPSPVVLSTIVGINVPR